MGATPFRVFWQPGCSSCVKLKEFLTQLRVPFESVNILTDEKAMDDLAKLGAQSIPIVSCGNEFVFGQSLKQVAEFIGKAAPRIERLPPDELMDRWTYFLDLARGQIAQISQEQMMFLPVPDRDRTVKELAYHIFQVPHSYIESVVDKIEDWTIRCNTPVPANVTTPEHVLNYAMLHTAELKVWWAQLADKNCQWSVATHYGNCTGHELLERQTWHSAQHVRQLQSVMEDLGISLKMKITPDAYRGLPMPIGLWE